VRQGVLIYAIAILALGCGAAGRAYAQSDWDVVINGRAVHLNSDRDWNENNFGIGIEREFDSASRWVKVALANGFRDSTDRPSYMAGGGMKRRFHATQDLYVDIGLVGFVMTRRDVEHNKPFLGALPAISVGTKKVALNLTYIPQMGLDYVGTNRNDPRMSGVVFLQLKLDSSLFGFGRGSRTLFADSNP